MIILENVTKSYKSYTVHYNTLKSYFLNWKQYKKQTANIDTFTPVNQLSLTIPESEILCIVGPNGAGKSTLAKLIAGTIIPTVGKISVKGKIVPFLELGVAFSNELTGEDNLYLNGVLLGLSLKYLRKNKNKIFQFAEIEPFMNMPLKYYSSGMQLRLAFSIAMHADGDVYIFDEILAVGDSAFQKKCFAEFDKLIQNKKTIIIITHDIDFVRKHATRLLVLTPRSHYIIDDISSLSEIQDMSYLVEYCEKYL